MNYNSSSFDCFVYGATMEEVRDALVKRFNAEVEIEPGYEDEWELALHHGEEYMNSYIFEWEKYGEKGVSVRTVFFLGDFHWWAEEIFKCLTEALPYDVMMNQNSVRPGFVLRRKNGVITRKDHHLTD